MCLTLTNAAAVIDHRDTTRAGRGYTATSHHVGHLTPGDWWRPVSDQPPRTVTEIHRHRDRITLTDQYGTTWTYPAGVLVPTAVPESLLITAPTKGTR